MVGESLMPVGVDIFKVIRIFILGTSRQGGIKDKAKWFVNRWWHLALTFLSDSYLYFRYI